MASTVGADAVAGGAAGPGVAGVVSRPRLFGRLAAQARVSVVSAPPGSGKTVLLRSWISWAGVAGSAAWVPAGRGERDSQRFWLSVLAALRQTAAGSVLVRELTAAPELDGWVITERLLTDLAPLDDQLWLVVDDVHELGPDALAQLELLIMRGPPGAAGQARQDEAEVWVQRAERTITAGAAQPAMFAGIRYVRGVVEMARDHDAEALAAFEAAEQLARRLAAPHYLISRIRAWMLRSLIRLGQIDRAGLFLAGLSGEERERGEVRVGAAEVELARGNPSAALAELAAIQEGPGSGYYWGFWQVRAHGQVRTADPHHEQRDRQCQIQPTVLAPRTAFPVCVQLAASPRG